MNSKELKTLSDSYLNLSKTLKLASDQLNKIEKLMKVSDYRPKIAKKTVKKKANKNTSDIEGDMSGLVAELKRANELTSIALK